MRRSIIERQRNSTYVTVTRTTVKVYSAMTEIDAAQKRAALQRIVRSAEFNGAERLKAFLTYIVEQEIAGNKNKIIGKTILADVYNNGLRSDADTATVVRVDASRMRQRLDAYYNEEGKRDSVRISVDKGGYVPRFTPGFSQSKPTAGDSSSYWSNYQTSPTLASLVVAAALGVAATVWFSEEEEERGIETSEVSPQARTALFENAPNKLLARNTAEEAREMLFPATQLIRVSAALSMFEDAMRLDPSYYGGFAGASQASSILAALSPEETLRNRHFQNAQTHASTALTLDATKAWSHSALAFTRFIGRDFDGANEASLKALELEPNNPYSLEIDAVVALFSGHFDRAISSADPKLHADRPGSGLPWRNALGNAHFHAGHYREAIKHLMDAIKVGEPVSEINTAHLIAAYQASGASERATELVLAYELSWPDSRISKVLPQLFRNPEDAGRVLIEMSKAGWTDPISLADGG